jgi:hypothetical protein
MVFVIALATFTSALYAAARFLLHPNLGGSIAAGLLLLVLITIIAWRLNIRRFAEIRRMFAPALKPWMSLTVTLGVAAMGMTRHDLPIPLAVLDSAFAFAFFSAFSSLFVKRTLQ